MENEVEPATLRVLMRLDKWYLDAVLDDGSVWYGYQARLKFWGPLVFHWASGCRVLADGTEQKVSIWKQAPAPEFRDGAWRWASPDGFLGEWQARGGGHESALGSDAELGVQWRCVTPMAAVRLCRCEANFSGTSQTAPALKGIGYIEHLTLTSGSKMPFHQLWWGRAHAGESSLVWIRWGRGREFDLVLENGRPVRGEMKPFQGGMRVRTATGTWETGGARVLCDRDVRISFPPMLVRLVRGVVPSRERKMSGAVSLRTADSGETRGSGVWEEVLWA